MRDDEEHFKFPFLISHFSALIIYLFPGMSRSDGRRNLTTQKENET